MLRACLAALCVSTAATAQAPPTDVPNTRAPGVNYVCDEHNDLTGTGTVSFQNYREHHSSTAPQLHSSTAPQLHSSTAPQLHSSTAPQLHSSTAPQLHSSTARGSFFFTKGFIFFYWGSFFFTGVHFFLQGFIFFYTKNYVKTKSYRCAYMGIRWVEGVYFVFSSEKWLTRPLSVIYSVSFFHSSPKFVDRVKTTLAKRVFSPHFSFASIRGSVCFSSVPGLTCVQQVCYFY